MTDPDIVVSIITGVGLAATTGSRIFMPMPAAVRLRRRGTA